MSNLTDNTAALQEALASLQGKAAGSGGGGGIIEVLQLPTENIDTRYLYRVTFAALYFNNVLQGTTYVVDELPATGEPVTTDGSTVTVTYYNDTDNTLYGYLPEAIASVLGVPEGWYTAETLIPSFGYAYGGVVTNLNEATEKETFYLLLTNPLYSYEDGNWYEVATTGASLTLKTRVFHSFEDALVFCPTHNVYKIESGFLNIENATGTFGLGSYVSVYASSFDGVFHTELRQCWSGNSFDALIVVFNSKDGMFESVCKTFDFETYSFTYQRATSIELMEGATITVYYFA